jgi:tetratricopeptide (TPR) repeat protein
MPRRRVWWFSALLAAATIGTYGNSLSNPFVFDDTDAIAGNATIRTLTPLTRALRGPAQSATAGRPTVNLSLALNYAWGGLSPRGYRVWNIGVHLLCALLLFGIVRRTLAGLEASASTDDHGVRRRRTESRARRPEPEARSLEPAWLAFACALLWLVHPLQTEVINYLTQRTESMMGLAYMATLYAAMRAMTAGGRAAGRRWGWQVLAVATCAAGMATKESMATAPLMVLLYDVVFAAGSVRRALRERAPLYAGLATTWIIVSLVVLSGPRFRSAGLSSGITPWAYLLNQPPVILDYLRLAIWPHPLVLDYGMPRPLTLVDVLPSATAVVLLLALTIVLWRRHRALAFLCTWFFVTLAPTSSVVPIATEVAAERRMYLPLAAVIVLLVVATTRGVEWLAARDRQRQILVCGAILTAACIGLVTLTVRRNREYRTNIVIWQTVIDRAPHPRAHYNLGIALNEAGRRDEAIAHYRTAAAGKLPVAHYALGFELVLKDRHAEAVEQLREYIRQEPENVNVIRAYNLLGRALMALDRLPEAEAAFREVLRMRPQNTDALGAFADALLAQRRFDEAIVGYRNYLRHVTDQPIAHFNLGVALGERNRPEEAAIAFAAAVNLAPDEVAFRVNLANTLETLGRVDEALRHYRAALQLQPDDLELRAYVDDLVRRHALRPDS